MDVDTNYTEEMDDREAVGFDPPILNAKSTASGRAAWIDDLTLNP